MKHCIFSIGYWVLHSAGIFPVALKNPEGNSRGFFYDRKTSWTPWTSSKRSLVFGIGQLIVILYDSGRLFVRRVYDVDQLQWSRNYLRKIAFDLLIGQRAFTMSCAIMIAIVRRREFEKLLNDTCSFYYDVLRHTGPPKTQKFHYLIIYSVLNFVLNIALLFISTTSSIEDIFWQLPYTLSYSYIHIVLCIGLVYIQTAVEGLNSEIKGQFPDIDEWDFKSWEPESTEDGNRRKLAIPQINAKYFIQGYRRMFRKVGKIVQEINSVSGFLLLAIVVFNQTACQLLAFAHNSLYIPEIVVDNYWLTGSLALGCVWCLVMTTVICHSFEIVIREIQMTTYYIASIDASRIDQDSKTELLEFLDEIEGCNIKFMAFNIFSLDYPTLYLMLSSTVTYIIIVIQYLSA